jgi:hypothetical protein
MTLILMVVGLLALGGQSFAELCTIDAVPAATLLVPYFEVDLADPAGVTTLFSINNASAAPALAHVIFWTDWSAPTIDFDLYLTGYDVVSVNVRDVFQSRTGNPGGDLPRTADAPNDPGQGSFGTFLDDLSPYWGANSINAHWDDTDPTTPAIHGVLSTFQGFPGCNAILPFGADPVLNPGTRAFDRLTNGHTGQPVDSIAGFCGTGNCCLGGLHDDPGGSGTVARGYITIDSVSECSLVLDPADATGPYFSSDPLASPIANNNNQLWGDWFLVDLAGGFAQGDTLVHIEADSSLASDPVLGFVGPNSQTGYTFYGRYFGPLPDGRDQREPLGTTWGTRFLGSPAFDQTQLVVWRDSTFNTILNNGERCGTLEDRLLFGLGSVGPDWFPLNEREVIAWNEAEDAVEICFFTGGQISPPEDDDPACFPYETGRYTWGVSPLDSPFEFGWAYLNLNIPGDVDLLGVNEDVDFPVGTTGNISQSYVVTLHQALGLYSVGLQAVELTDACQNLDLLINGLFVNGGQNTVPFF